MLILLLMLNVNTQQANPLQTAFRFCRKIGYLGALYGVSYCLAQYLNSRNSSRSADIQYSVINHTLTIKTDGQVTIQGQAEAQGITIKTDQLDPDRQNHSLLEPDTPVPNAAMEPVTQVPTQNGITRFQRFWRWITRSAGRTATEQANTPMNANIAEPLIQNAEPHSIPTTPAQEQHQNQHHENRLLNLFKWIIRPAHRAITHHTIDVPQNFNIDVEANNGITINGINGAIKASSGSSAIGIVNPTGNVTVETLGNVEIENFRGDITAKQFGHFHATRHASDATSYVTLDDEIQPTQAEYIRKRA